VGLTPEMNRTATVDYGLNWLFLIVAFTTIFRLLIFSDFKPTGTDPLAHLLRARELVNAGRVPSVHSLYLPGTPWVYPPLFHAVLSCLLLLGAPPLESVFGLGLVSDVLIAVPIFFIGTRLNGIRSGALAVTLFAIDTSHIYPLTWGGYPNLMASLFMAMGILALMDKAWKSVPVLAMTTLAIGLTHYLSLAVWIVILAVFILLSYVQRARSKILSVVLALVVAGIALVSWYLPRLATYWSLLATGPDLAGLVSAGLVQLIGLYLVTFGLGGFLVVILPLTLFRLPWRRNPELYAWALAPLLLSIPFMTYPNIVIRMLYFATTPSLLAFSAVALSGVERFSGPNSLIGAIDGFLGRIPIVTAARRIWYSRRSYVILLILLLFAFQSVYFGVRAHSFYRTYDPELVQLARWFAEHATPSKTIAAELVPGLFVAALSPRPVIFVANEAWFSLIEERELIRAARLILSSSPTEPIFMDLVCRYSVGYLIYSKSLPVWYASGGNGTVYVLGSYFVVELNTRF